MPQGFEGLAVWQKAHELMLFVHREIIPCLPSEEKWDLASQIRRASKSVGANIAEGYGRFYFRDNIRFCYNARGSLTETENHLVDARDLSYIPSDVYQRGRHLASEAQRLLNGYIAFLKQKRPGDNEPGHDIPALSTNIDDPDSQPLDQAGPSA